jgi:hypothetical protein
VCECCVVMPSAVWVARVSRPRLSTGELVTSLTIIGRFNKNSLVPATGSHNVPNTQNVHQGEVVVLVNKTIYRITMTVANMLMNMLTDQYETTMDATRLVLETVVARANQYACTRSTFIHSAQCFDVDNLSVGDVLLIEAVEKIRGKRLHLAIDFCTLPLTIGSLILSTLRRFFKFNVGPVNMFIPNSKTPICPPALYFSSEVQEEQWGSCWTSPTIVSVSPPV